MSASPEALSDFSPSPASRFLETAREAGESGSTRTRAGGTAA